MNNNTNDTHTHTQKKQLYRWIGLVIGLILGLGLSFGYYKWAKKKAVVYFQENIGESGFATEYQKWAVKNPLQAREMAEKTWKGMGIYEELKNETDPEIIQQKVMERRKQMSKEEQRKSDEKALELMKKHAPSFLEKVEEEFPWHLRYYWLIIILIVFASSGISFLVGYLLEPVEEVKY
jgi:hypothetical protein